MVDQQPTDAADLELNKDASGTPGCGAYFQGEWFHHNWQLATTSSATCVYPIARTLPNCRCSPHLGPHLAAKACQILLWQPRDCQLIGRQIYKHPCSMSLVHTLFLTVAKNNYTVSLKHLIGKTNEIVDRLSGKQFIPFFHLTQALQLPTPTPEILRELWMLNCKISCL